jgi:hypothetical protein
MMYFYAMRMSVMLPAKALGIPGITIQEVLYRTRKNNWRIMVVFLLCSVIQLVLLLAIQRMHHYTTGVCTQNMHTSLLEIGQIIAIGLVVKPVQYACLALTYQFFCETTA